MTFSLILAYFGGHFVTIATIKNEINTQSNHFDHSTNKTSRRNCCTVTFIFWLLKGPKDGLNARPPFAVAIKLDDIKIKRDIS